MANFKSIVQADLMTFSTRNIEIPWVNYFRANDIISFIVRILKYFCDSASVKVSLSN